MVAASFTGPVTQIRSSSKLFCRYYRHTCHSTMTLHRLISLLLLIPWPLLAASIPKSSNGTTHLSKRAMIFGDSDVPGKRVVNGYWLDTIKLEKLPSSFWLRVDGRVRAVLRDPSKYLTIFPELDKFSPWTKANVFSEMWHGESKMIPVEMLRIAEDYAMKLDPLQLLDTGPGGQAVEHTPRIDPWKRVRKMAKGPLPSDRRKWTKNMFDSRASEWFDFAESSDPTHLLDTARPNPGHPPPKPPPDWRNPFSIDVPRTPDLVRIPLKDQDVFWLRRWWRRMKAWIRRVVSEPPPPPPRIPWHDPIPRPPPYLKKPLPLYDPPAPWGSEPKPNPPQLEPELPKPEPEPADPRPGQPGPGPDSPRPPDAPNPELHPPNPEQKPPGPEREAPHVDPKPTVPLKPTPPLPKATPPLRTPPEARFPHDPAPNIPEATKGELAARFSRIQAGESTMKVFPQLAGLAPEMQARTLYALGLPKELTGAVARKIPMAVASRVMAVIGENVATVLMDFYTSRYMMALDAVLTVMDIVTTIMMIIDLVPYDMGTCDAKNGVCLLSSDVHRHEEHRCHTHHPCRTTGDTCGHRGPEPHRTICNWHQREVYHAITGRGPWKEILDELGDRASADDPDRWHDHKGCKHITKKKKEGCEKNKDYWFNECMDQLQKRHGDRKKKTCEYTAEATVHKCKQTVEEWRPNCVATRKILIEIEANSPDPSNTINPPPKPTVTSASNATAPMQQNTTMTINPSPVQTGEDPLAHEELPAITGVPKHDWCHNRHKELKKEHCHGLKEKQKKKACENDVEAWEEKCKLLAAKRKHDPNALPMVSMVAG